MQNRFGAGIVRILQLFIKYTAELSCGKQNLRMKSKEFRVLKYTYSMVIVAYISSNKTRVLQTFLLALELSLLLRSLNSSVSNYFNVLLKKTNCFC